jgi:hypothetical protein
LAKKTMPTWSEGDVFITRVPDGRYGAVRVLRRQGRKSSVVYTTQYLDKEKPQLTNPLLKKPVKQRRFFYRGELARKWCDGPPPAEFELLGNLPVTVKEAKLECNTYGGWPWDEAWLEWRGEHDRAAFEEEVRREQEKRDRASRKPQKPKKMIAEMEFWAIIDLLDWKKTGNDDKVLEPAIAALAKRSQADIRQFYERFAYLLYQLDTKSHAKQLMDEDEYFSADEFLYVRCCVVANGKKFYESVLKNPKKMPKDLEFESLLRLAPEAFERRTGEDMDYLTGCSFETFSNVEGWKE